MQHFQSFFGKQGGLFPPLCSFRLISLLILTAGALAACSQQAGNLNTTSNPIEQTIAEDSVQDIPNPQPLAQDLERSDSQGAVDVVVLPLNLLERESGSIEFEVRMNTHSVDLSMDLASLSFLETDQGAVWPAHSWTGGSGHHVTGILTFPVEASNGMDAFETASRIILTILDVDAPERRFQWDLNGPR